VWCEEVPESQTEATLEQLLADLPDAPSIMEVV
jgi:hypothetical protein